MAFVSLNPSTGRRLKSYRATTTRQLNQLLDAQVAAQTTWRATKPSARARLLRALSRELLNRADDLAALITAEMGKPVSQSLAEVRKCTTVCDYYAKNGPAWLKPEIPLDAPAGASVVHAPMGVILAIMPWNFPLWQAIRAAVPALMAGNAMLLKHASNVSGCGLALADVFTAAGFPANLFATVLIDGPTASDLIGDPRIAGVTLTGSTQAGQRVASAAGSALKPCVLELGGSDPYLIFADADIPAAAKICATARMNNAGQTCIAAKRFIVDRRVKDAFTLALVTAMSAYHAGDPTEPGTTLGPLAREDLRDELHAQVERCRELGANILLGGTLPAGRGWYYPATVLADVVPGMPAYDDEIFGPVAAIIEAQDETDALRIANDTPFGLGAAIFTRRVARARQLAAAEITAGTIAINRQVISDARLPFGGTKQSGFGRELALPGLRAFAYAKTIMA